MPYYEPLNSERVSFFPLKRPYNTYILVLHTSRLKSRDSSADTMGTDPVSDTSFFISTYFGSKHINRYHLKTY